MRPLPFTLAALALTALAASAPLGLASPTPSTAPSATASSFAVDNVHSSVLFKVKHNGAAYFYGRFAEMSGEFTFDEAAPTKSEVMIEVQAGSVDTRNERLNGHLLSPDFFDAKQFPVISFVSTKIEPAGESRYKVTGELSLHGVTKELTVEMEHTGSAAGRSGKVVGFHSTFTIKRSEFGMTYGDPARLGDEVEIILSIEAGER